MIEILILSIVQGFTEFIPVSSSSHLLIISEFTNFENKSLSIDVSLHIGSFLAVVVYFHKDIFNFIENKSLFLKILVSSVPTIIVGFFLVKFNIIDQLRNLEIVSWTTLIFGILLYISDKFKLEKNIKNNFNLKHAMLIGAFQVFSLIPGVSRSGITLTAGRILNYKRIDAAKLSFLFSIPTLGAVSFYGMYDIYLTGNKLLSIFNFFSIFLSFIFSFITIKYFLRYIQSFSLNIFIVYRIVVGVALLCFTYL